MCVCVCVCASLHPPANMQCDARTRADTYRAQTQTHTCVMQLLFESSQPVGTDHELLVAELYLHKPRIERSSTERLNTSSRVVESDSPHSVSCTTHEQYLTSRTLRRSSSRPSYASGSWRCKSVVLSRVGFPSSYASPRQWKLMTSVPGRSNSHEPWKQVGWP